MNPVKIRKKRTVKNEEFQYRNINEHICFFIFKAKAKLRPLRLSVDGPVNVEINLFEVKRRSFRLKLNEHEFQLNNEIDLDELIRMLNSLFGRLRYGTLKIFHDAKYLEMRRVKNKKQRQIDDWTDD